MSDAYDHAASSSSASSPSVLFHNENSNRGTGAMLLVHDAGDGNGGIGAAAQLFAAALAAAAASSSSSASVPYLYDDAAATAASSSSTVPPPAHPPPPILDTWRVPPSLFTVFVSFYAAVFFCGLVGNVFVVAAIALNKTFRTATDWLISSLAIADLLILMFCLPSTLLNNLLTEWQLGSWGCKLSVWVNSTTSCASIFTLVGVTGDRYLAICHPLRQLKMKNSLLHLYILGIWLLSALMASPNLWVYRQILYDLISGQQLSPDDVQQHHHNSYNNNGIISSNNGQLVARLCVDTSNNIWLFIVINLLVAFLVPIVVICVLYALIFRAVSRHTRKKLAVDNGARIRDERVKLRIAQMMFTVIVVFVLCWTPLYALYCYFFMAEDRDSMFFQFASSVLRPIFQWLSLLSSSLNPLIYIAFSQKYRRAFHSLLLFPCRRRYKEFKQATRSTFRRSSCFSEKPSTVQLFSCQLGNNNYALRGEENVCANYNFSNNNNIHRKSADSALGQQTATIRQQQQQQQLRKVSFTTAATIGGMATAQQRQQQSTASTWRKMSEQSPLPLHLQQQRLNGGAGSWRPLPPSFNSSSCCSPSSRLTTATTTTTSCGEGTTTNGGGPPMVANLLRRVALENSQRQWWQRQKMASMQSNDSEQDENGSSKDSKKRWRGGDAERKRREWREAMTASPERRMARDDNGGGGAAEDSSGGTCTGRRATAAAASNRTRSADPLLRAISDTCGTATGD